MRRSLLVYLLPLMTGACYSYRTVELAELPAGTAVRARISAAEAERVESLLGRSDARTLEGVLVQSDTAAITLQVPTAARAAPGGGIEMLHQRLLLPRANVVEVELKQLSRPRTYGLIGAGAAIAIYLTIEALNGSPGSDGPPGGGGPPELRIPISRLIR
jgi:hypothetical protein